MTRTARALMLGTALMTLAAPAVASAASGAQSQPGGASPMQVHAMAQQPALNLSAYGEVKVAPDQATINFGVVTEAPTAQEAMAQNATRMNQVIAAHGGCIIEYTGDGVLAAQAMGADFAYIGSAFIATEEARAVDAYKQCIVDSGSDDIVYSSLFTGVHGNYLKPSVRNAGLDPDNLPESDPSKMNFGGDKSKAWKDIWGCGQGIGAVKAVVPAGELVARLKREYLAARQRVLGA